VKIRQGDYTLYGLSSEAFTIPTHFKMYNVEDDPDEMVDLASVSPKLFEELKHKMLGNV